MFRKSFALCGTALMFAVVRPGAYGLASVAVTAQNEPASAALPVAEIFAPGVVSGPANDGAPTFSPDGNTIFFTRSSTHWTVILESHKENGQWSKGTLASFSGEWPDSSPAMSPDGSYIVFQSTRPIAAAKDGAKPVPVSNLWRVDRVGSGWSKPVRLPDAVNVGSSIWKPSIAADGTIYLTVIDDKGGKRLYSSKLVFPPGLLKGVYEKAQPLAFSDGTTADVDPEIAPDGSFLVFCSSGRLKGDEKDHLYLVRRDGVRKDGDGWGKVVQIRYEGDEKPYGYSTDDEPRLGPDHRTVYFSSDRVVVVHFPRTHEQAERDLERLEMWDNSNSNVWSISIAAWL
jgi:WD40-like Beta Propeller Repeat